MSEVKYTPGPWVAQRDWESVFSPDPEELEFYMKRPITAIRSLTADKDVALCHDLFEFNPDDAQLIAAAPELLEALEGLLAEVQHLERDYPEDYNFKRYRDALVKTKRTGGNDNA